MMSNEATITENSERSIVNNIIIQGTFKEFKKSRKKKHYYVIKDEAKMEQLSQYYLLISNKKCDLNKSQLKCKKVNLNDCVCVYNYEFNETSDKLKELNKCKFTKAHQHHTITTQRLAIFIFTRHEHLFIGFDDDYTRSKWLNVLIKHSPNIKLTLKMYQVSLKLSNCVNENLLKLLKTQNTNEFRLCIDDNCSNYVYLRDNHENNLIKLNISHIKRIGHKKPNNFIIELGKRSTYGHCMFIFKCEFYDIARYLHRKLYQLIEKSKEFDGSNRLFKHDKNFIERSNKYPSFISISNSNLVQKQHSPSCEQPLNESTQQTTEQNFKLKRYYTLFSRNSSKLKTQVSGVFKRLSLTRLTNTKSDSNISSTSKSKETFNNKLNRTYDASQEIDTKSYMLMLPERANTICDDLRRSLSIDEYVEYCSSSEKKSNDELKTVKNESVITRCATDSCYISNNSDKMRNEVFVKLPRDRMLTVESVSGYESSSLRSSSCGSSYKNSQIRENDAAYCEADLKCKIVGNKSKLNGLKKNRLDSINDGHSTYKYQDTYSFMDYNQATSETDDEEENVELNEENNRNKIEEEVFEEEFEPPFNL